jgi:predicted nucleic acid-binding protein
MSSFLLDTGLIIRHLRGQRRAVQLMRGLSKAGRLGIASITRLEIHAGMHPNEKFATRKLLSRFLTIDLDKETADRSGDLIYQARTQQISLSVPDAIIAATAVQHNLTLVTLNQSDFENIPGLRLQPID